MESSSQFINNDDTERENISIDAPSETTPRPDFLTMPRFDQIRAVEVLLFASEEPLSAHALYALLQGTDEAEKKTTKSNKNHLSESLPVGTNGLTKTNGTAKNGTHTDTQEHRTEAADSDDVRIALLNVEPPEGTLDAAFAIEVQQNTPENDNADSPERLIASLIDELNQELATTGRVFRIVEMAREGGKGYQCATNPEHGELLSRLVKSKSKKRLSKAGLETLAIIAYRQPVSKPELEVIRGVSSNEIMNRLLEKNLITIVGRSESVGKPLLYGTTDEFLRLFGLHSLADLPKPRELEELMAERADVLEVAQVLVPPMPTGVNDEPSPQQQPSSQAFTESGTEVETGT
ncbi:MAG: SMC-Scp complex subunit ScpB [Candidatus Kapabacteria bacterium]|jgi:segregation and condensation protein B|nr:SMC-Scp complex subunit ScpB [Candidatus Kapabacteria bacterium]